MRNGNDKAGLDYAILLIAVMFWIMPLYKYLMKC